MTYWVECFLQQCSVRTLVKCGACGRFVCNKHRQRFAEGNYACKRCLGPR
ncbi:hypothetical protein LCGC14_0745490 [marine sediment metagenome]|uniref:Uncharacterized protein n=1 Tax=marine sediment metagenome TaxID=412755 RepID=A0A0F9SQP3_9ZZZZ